MEPRGLVLGSVQALVQDAGVLKRQVNAITSLHTHSLSIENEALYFCSVARQISTLSEMPGLCSEMFQRTQFDIEEIHAKLLNLNHEIEQWKKFGLLILRAPILERSLYQLDAELTQLDFYFRTIALLGSLITMQRTEARENLVSALSAALSTTNNPAEARYVISDFASAVQNRISRDDCLDPNADLAYTMGLACYDSKPEKAIIASTSSSQIQKAARYFSKACKLGKREAFRYLGDIYYDGKGTERSYKKAVEIYEQGVAHNDPGAKFALGWCYEFAHGVSESAAKAIQFYQQACDEGCAEAMATLGYLKLHGKMVRSNHSDAFRLLTKASQLGISPADLALATCYERGISVERDPVKAFELYQNVFNRGNLFSTVELANCYDRGYGVKQDARKAAEVYERCINAGTFHKELYKAYYGLRLLQGLGVQQDIVKGRELILDATKCDTAYAWYVLAECYMRGFGFVQDKRRAKALYRRAASCASGVNGIVSAYMALGRMFETGDGVRVDILKANKYYVEGAIRLCPLGQWKAALAFESGVGLRKNINRAVFFFEMCANSGHIGAQHKYIAYYMKGHGVERSRVHARKIIEQSAWAGNRDAKRWLRREKYGSVGSILRSWSV